MQFARLVVSLKRRRPGDARRGYYGWTRWLTRARRDEGPRRVPGRTTHDPVLVHHRNHSLGVGPRAARVLGVSALRSYNGARQVYGRLQRPPWRRGL